MDLIDGEISKVVQDYPNYLVTNFGRIYSLNTNRFLKQHKNRGGYFSVNMCIAGLKPRNARVHRLVARAFLEEMPEDKPDVNHIDGNKENNRIENLEWSNKSLNGFHAHKLGLNVCNPQKGSKHGMARLSDEDIKTIRELKKTETNKQIASRYNISTTHVWRIVTNRGWKHLGETIE